MRAFHPLRLKVGTICLKVLRGPNCLSDGQDAAQSRTAAKSKLAKETSLLLVVPPLTTPSCGVVEAVLLVRPPDQTRSIEWAPQGMEEKSAGPLRIGRVSGRATSMRAPPSASDAELPREKVERTLFRPMPASARCVVQRPASQPRLRYARARMGHLLWRRTCLRVGPRRIPRRCRVWRRLPQDGARDLGTVHLVRMRAPITHALRRPP